MKFSRCVFPAFRPGRCRPSTPGKFPSWTYITGSSPIVVFKKVLRHPPALPYRRQHSTIGRTGLNHRVRDGNGCDPRAHRHRRLILLSRPGLFRAPRSHNLCPIRKSHRSLSVASLFCSCGLAFDMSAPLRVQAHVRHSRIELP